MTINYLFPVGEPVNLDAPLQDELVCGSNKRWQAWTEMIQPIRARALESNQLYLENRPDAMDFEKPDDATGSRIRRPVMAEAIDSTLAQQHLASYPSDERFFKARARNEMAKGRIGVYEKHVEKRLSLIDFMINSLKDRKNKMLAGASAVWHPFMYEEELKTSYEYPKVFGIRIPGKPKRVRKEMRTFEGTGFVPLHFEDWRVDPTVDNLKEANFIWRRWMPVEELKAVEGIENTGDIAAYNATDESASSKKDYYEKIGITRTWDDDGSPLCEHALVYEEWGDFYIEDEFYPNHVLIYSNDAVFHYFGPNPYDHQRKPFTVAPYIPLSGTLYGKSMAQDIIPLQHALDSMLNQQLDAFSIAVSMPFTYLVNDDAITTFFDDGPVSLRPGEGIPCKQHDSIRPLQWPMDVINLSEGAQQRLKEEIRESTGGVPYATGGASEMDQQRTLGEVQILASGTNTRFQLNIQIYEEGHLKPYLEMTFANDRQYMTQAAFVDDEPEPLLPDMVKMMDLAFDVTGSRSVMNRSKEIQEMDTILAALPMWIKEGYVQSNGDVIKVNIPEMLKRRVQLNSSFRDLDNFSETITLEEQQEQPMNLGVMNGPQAVQGPSAVGAPPVMPGVQPVPGNQVA